MNTYEQAFNKKQKQSKAISTEKLKTKKAKKRYTKKMNLFKLFKPKKKEIRIDSMQNQFTGMGSLDDKLIHNHPDNYTTPNTDASLLWWQSLSLLRKVINAPTEDSLRNGFKIKTNLDALSKKTNLSRFISNRLEEIGINEILLNALRALRIYSNGCIVYYIVESDIPQNQGQLINQLPEKINRLVAVNVVTPDKFSHYYKVASPLSSEYNSPTVLVEGNEIHKTRYNWLVKDYNRKTLSGRSILDDCLEIAKSHNIATWSVSSLLYEMATKIYKSPFVGTDVTGEKLQDFLRRIRVSLSTQSILALNTEESFEKKTYDVHSMDDMLKWVIDNISIVSEIPQARLKGAAHGVLASGNYDMQSYFESVKRIQANYLKPILNRIIEIILKEDETKKIISDSTKVDWEVEFEPLWQLSELETADIELKKAQRDKVDIESGKLSPQEARQLDKRLNSLEPFDTENS